MTSQRASVATAIMILLIALLDPAARIVRAQAAARESGTIAVSAGPVTLGDLVPDAPDALRAVEVAEAPPPGHVLYVSRSAILRALRRTGADATGLVLPRGLRIALRMRRISRQELAELVAPAVAESARPAPRLVMRELPLSMELPEGAISVEIERTADGAGPRCAATGSCRVSLPARIVVSGLTVRRLAIVVERQVEAPALSRGGDVRIVVQIGNVVIRTPGRALEAGAVGDTVRVENLATHRTMPARIVDSRTVEVAP